MTIASSFSTLFSLIQIAIVSPEALLQQNPQVYIYSLCNAFFCTVLPMLMIMYAVQRIGSSLTSQSGILGPVSTIFMGWYFLQEAITLNQVMGMLLVIFAIWLLMRDKA